MSDLKTWDPQRYGALGDSNNGQSYDIFTQAAQVVKADSATVLGGLTPRRLIGAGDSQSAFRVDTYVNAIQPLTHAFNGFLAVGRAVTAAPLGNGLISTSPFRRSFAPTTRRRSSRSTRRVTSSSSTRPPPDRLVSGVQPPHGRPISTIPVFFGLYDIVNADRYGIGLGGIRVPEAQVPVEDYSPINFAQTNSSNLNPIALLSEAQSALAALSTGSINNSAVRSAGLCLLSGYFLDLPHPTLQALYPTLSNYVSKYTAAADAEVASRFLTPADAAAAFANAQAGHGPSQTPASTIP